MALSVFLATAVADEVEGRRPGARHAMLIYVFARDFEAAQRKAAGVALGAGWMMVRLEKGMEVVDPAANDDPVLRAAAGTALEEGSAIVVYGDELPPEA
ncbi:hypothetical protein FHS95_003809 [Sphingomonas naasensis]|uniref:Uncharacterized protein n=1 Tax=Sphingomonas naasensis TaxID=1344951 RepID=A0A4S1WKD3_9SPHN|nr:hypothetical protein [Sphingomonas naasensis]NIJ22098.1 hypothetical protein [Sphingomonas naasensis]TGX42230.1 hypothetical protein E5A74_10240 [Sphingomonas naasensis]